MKKIMTSLVFLITVFSLVFVFTSCIYSFGAYNVFGRYDCKTCQDTSVIICRDCNGRKQHACRRCGGDGEAMCILCGGMGSRTCISCGGMGGRSEYDYFSGYYVYRACSCVGGRVRCAMTMVCSCGDGKVDCTTCGARGRVPCPDCSSDAKDAP